MRNVKKKRIHTAVSAPAIGKGEYQISSPEIHSNLSNAFIDLGNSPLRAVRAPCQTTPLQLPVPPCI